jgi:hypothetical protein
MVTFELGRTGGAGAYWACVPVGSGIGWNDLHLSIRLGALDSVSEGFGDIEVADVVAGVADVGEPVPGQVVRGTNCGLVCAELYFLVIRKQPTECSVPKCSRSGSIYTEEELLGDGICPTGAAGSLPVD